MRQGPDRLLTHPHTSSDRECILLRLSAATLVIDRMRDKAVVRSSSSAVCTKREAGREGAQCNRRDRMNSRAPKCPNTRLSPNFTVLTCTYQVCFTCTRHLPCYYFLPGTCSHIRLRSEARCPVSPCSCECVMCWKIGPLNTDYKT